MDVGFELTFELVEIPVRLGASLLFQEVSWQVIQCVFALLDVLQLFGMSSFSRVDALRNKRPGLAGGNQADAGICISGLRTWK